MSKTEQQRDDVLDHGDAAPGEESIEEHGPGGLAGYQLGFGLAILLTAASFLAARTNLIYQPAVISALTVLAIAQMGVHLVGQATAETGLGIARAPLGQVQALLELLRHRNVSRS